MTAEAIPLRTRGGIYRPDRTLLRFTGPDALRYLNGQITNDIRSLAPGHSMPAAVCTPKGKMCAEIRLALDGNGTCCVDGPLAARETLAARMEKYLVADDAEMSDATDQYLILHSWGPQHATPQASAVFTSDRLGLPGHDYLLPASAALPADLILDPDAAESVRIESGLPAWGLELDDNTLPPEICETRWIRYDKGCYVGQETIARIKSMGKVNRRMVGLISADGPIPLGPILAGDLEIGRATSATFSSALQKWIALGLVRSQDARDGVCVSTGSFRAQIASLPLVT